MKIQICILIIGLAFTACHSQKKMAERRAAYVSTQPVAVTVTETVQDTVVIEPATKPEPIRQETVTKTQGVDLMHYCVIVGSFMNEQNAINLRNGLIRQGFLGTSIMQNAMGMYRVSIECEDTHTIAWEDLTRIRNHYPQFRDAWLLELK